MLQGKTMHSVTYYAVQKTQGVDTALAYTNMQTGKICVFSNLKIAENIAKEIGPGWEAKPLIDVMVQ